MARSFHTPYGPQVEDNGVTFRLWAPSASSVSVVINDAAPIAMHARERGWLEGTAPEAKTGDRYHFLVDGNQLIPDPASHFQPEVKAIQSEIVDPENFAWTDTDWKGRPWEEVVLYELHTGCFSPSGTYKGIEEKLGTLAELGITSIELMPVADFPGSRGWGYDGVLPYAPETAYGRPQELKQLVNAAHGRGLMVFLDVVYNHFGPEGNFLHHYASSFFTEKYKTPWGAGINVEGSSEVRRFFIDNALYWLKEFHFDGLRFDAVHAINDASDPHFLEELAKEVRAKLPADRHVHLVLENDKNEARYMVRDADQKTSLFNAQWNDDIHHVFHVLLTGETGGYYADYVQDAIGRLGRCLTEGFAYQGESSQAHSGESRGENSSFLPPQAFVAFLQNHDQIGNRAMGERITALASSEKIALGLAVLLLSPQIPMLFMGEEWAASTPFLYFCDYAGELAENIREGRQKEFAQFPEFSDAKKRARIPDPIAISTFEASKLRWEELQKPEHAQWRELVKALLTLRRQYIVPLLKEGLNAAPYSRLGGNALEVVWRTQSGKGLRLRANFSDNSVAVAPVKDNFIWGVRTKELSSWQCQWSVENHGG